MHNKTFEVKIQAKWLQFSMLLNSTFTYNLPLVS